jgi:hypothetical protein
MAPPIKQEISVSIATFGYNEETILGFYITNLGHDCIILGHPWFQAFNPTIDWTTNQLVGPDVVLKTVGYQSKTQIHSLSMKVPSNKEETCKCIPEQYHAHWQVFSKDAAQHFPPSQPDNHTIKLKLGVPAKLDCKIY